MSRTTAALVTAASAVVAGGSITFWAGTTLRHGALWTQRGSSTIHLDFVVASLLLIGIALLLMGLILLLGTATDYWIDAQERRDAQLAARRTRVEAERYRLAASLVQTRPETPRHIAH